MSLSWISLFKFLSLCLLALLEGYPLQFQKRILVIWLPDYLSLLSVLLSYSSESFSPNPKNALLGATSSSSICLSHSMPLLTPVPGSFSSLITSSTSIFSIFEFSIFFILVLSLLLISSISYSFFDSSAFSFFLLHQIFFKAFIELLTYLFIPCIPPLSLGIILMTW